MLKYVAVSIILFLIPITASEFASKDNEKAEYTLLHINAKWNKQNDIKFDKIKNCYIKYALLEDQTKELQSQVHFVPHVVLFKKNIPVQQWQADLSFKLKLSTQEVVEVIKSN